MASIHILGTGTMDDRDSAYPQAVQLPDGELLCSFSVGGGPNATGRTDYCRSVDNGATWQLEGTILSDTTEPATSNNLKLSLSADGQTIFAYGSRFYKSQTKVFGKRRNEPVFCTSKDSGHTWSAPQIIPSEYTCPLEVSFGIVPLSSGRLLAPAAALLDKDRLGEKVFTMISDDNGRTWDSSATVFQDPDGQCGYFEHKFTEFAPGNIMAVCWTVLMNDVSDKPNRFTISKDNGHTWGKSYSTGINGQTMTPIGLGGNKLLVLYNRRYGRQGIVMCLVTFHETLWTIHHEDILYDAAATYERPGDGTCGVKEFESFAFGFPTVIRLTDGTFLVTYWSKENGKFGIRYTRLRVDW